ncbi:MAG: Uma2 family endonuclease [Candidatus Eremiobacteraeota bacterium]|nr:Uma2 family endonuclease [Candidatus Eremiobacteraeota bacterium]
MVVCRPPTDPTVDVIDDVTVIIEIVSQNSAERDLLDKRREYVAMPAPEAYVAIFENEPKALVYRPSGSDVAVACDAVETHGVAVTLAELFT